MVGGAPVLSYTDPIFASFWDNPTTAAVVDYVSITLTNTSSLSTLSAYDNSGTFLGSTRGRAGETLTVTFPGQIYSVRIDQGPMAFDDFTFDKLTPAATADVSSVSNRDLKNPPAK